GPFFPLFSQFCKHLHPRGGHPSPSAARWTISYERLHVTKSADILHARPFSTTNAATDTLQRLRPRSVSRNRKYNTRCVTMSGVGCRRRTFARTNLEG